MKIILIGAIVAFSFSTLTYSQNMDKKYFANDQNVALGGYDVVNYFTDNQAARGSQNFKSEHDGATFYFVSDEHKQAFESAPKNYLPKYGGYCAFAMATQSAKAPSDPETFKIYNGELLLFYNDYWEGTPFNTIVPWNAEEQTMKGKADKNWQNQ